VAAVTTRLRVACDADLFASARNHRFTRYCSRFLEPGSVGDAFYTPWPGSTWWCYPPFSQRSRVLMRLWQYSVESDTDQELRHLLDGTPPVPCNAVEVVLLIQPVRACDPDATLWRRLQPRIVQSCWVWVPPDVPTWRRVRPLLPNLRLIGDEGRPAPRPPSVPLAAYLVRIPWYQPPRSP
jgi:hypothetical protein